MATQAPTDLPDGTLDFSGGQNSSLIPEGLHANEYYIGINVSCENTCLKPRWGYVEQELDFTNIGTYKTYLGAPKSFERLFREGKFQAFIPYSIGPEYYTLYIVSGFIYIINNQTLSVSVLNPLDQVNPNADRVNWSNAGNYLVIFDFPNNPFILSGITIDRANPTNNEVPVSNMGTYNQNRLCIANAGRDWTAGDPAGSTLFPKAPVTFNEIILPSTGFTSDVYQLPTNYGNDVITAMGFLQVVDTGTGIGPLLVSTDKAIYSYRTDLPRSQWQGGSQGFVFGSVLLYAAGIVGQRAHVNLNGDILFLCADGQIRTLTMARNAQQTWGNNPISREVDNFLEYTDPSLAQFASTTYFQNKVFVTCNPIRVNVVSSEGSPQTDFVNTGIVVLELNNMAGLNGNTPPVWTGAWTGIHYMDFAVNNKKLYCAAKRNGENHFYIIDPKKTYDVIEGKTRLVRSVVDTRAYTNTEYSVVGSNPHKTTNKHLVRLELGVRNVAEKLDLESFYRPTTSPNFHPWRNMVFNAPVEQCEAFPQYPNGLANQGIRDLSLGGVNDKECEPGVNGILAVYKAVQIRLILTGKYWELNYITLIGRIISMEVMAIWCKENEGKPVPITCFDPWFIPELDNEEC